MPDVRVQAVPAFSRASSVDETACSVEISEPRRVIVKHWLFVCVWGRAFLHAVENVGPQCWSSSDTETGLYLLTGHVRTARVPFSVHWQGQRRCWRSCAIYRELWNFGVEFTTLEKTVWNAYGLFRAHSYHDELKKEKPVQTYFFLRVAVNVARIC